MSISTISGSSSSSSLYEILQKQQQNQDSSGDFLDRITENLISSLDTDGDGSISLSETSGTKMSQDLFDSIDTDGDGELSASEIKADVKARQQALMTQMQSIMGSMSSASNAGSEDIMSLLGQMSQAGQAGMMPPPPPPDGGMQGGSLDRMTNDLISDLDTDGNGTLSMSEMSGTKMTQEVFDQIDTDGDGEISSDEIKANIEAKRQEAMSQMQSAASSASNGDSLIGSLLQNSSLLQGMQAYQNQMDTLLGLFEDQGVSLTA
ncbi:EF-Hand domain protein [Desulfovibrio sp. X2]|uniref:EF-hand domain-containing protein n=1 Tax=Desulfovibrio sp. X2 TaxID=941449 RepID=UPI0003589FF7|nr:EF-Hand domain protein [Desulfovibrio sp. X2]EPR44507.1 EF-Hand domain protein [Desulfovibrio sp. X2]